MELKEIAKKEDQKLEPKNTPEKKQEKPVETIKVDAESVLYRYIELITETTTGRIKKLLEDDSIWENPEKSRVAVECIDSIVRSLNEYKSTITNIYLVDKVNFKIS